MAVADTWKKKLSHRDQGKLIANWEAIGIKAEKRKRGGHQKDRASCIYYPLKYALAQENSMKLPYTTIKLYVRIYEYMCWLSFLAFVAFLSIRRIFERFVFERNLCKFD